jgi:serine/threonine protein kinase
MNPFPAPPLPPSREDFSRIEASFAEAVALPRDRREPALAASLGDRPDLRAEVEALLNAHDAVAAAAPPEKELRATPGAGARLGAYRLVEKIGEGGMGEVYGAERVDGAFEQRVAVKVTRATVNREDLSRRFKIERQILASLRHPNIVTLLDGGATEDGLAYFVMEYVEGTLISDYCHERALPLETRLQLFRTVCGAVQSAHQHGIVHRDLKPANILIQPDGVPKVLDFGLAKMVTTPEANREATVGLVPAPLTPNYASPEQLRGLPVTTACDVYALGVLLYELVTGVRPYETQGQSLDRIVAIVLNEVPPRPSSVRPHPSVPYPPSRLRGDVDAIVAKAMAKEAAERYDSAGELASDIGRVLRREPVLARPLSAAYVLRRLAVRHKTLVTVSVLALTAVVAASATALWQRAVARHEQARAERRFNDVRTLAQSFLFEVYDSISRLPGSLSARRIVASRAQQYLDSLASEAGNDPGLERELAESYLRLGDVRGGPYAANLGDTAGALESYRKAQALFEHLAKNQPDNIVDQERLAQANLKVGRVLTRQKSVAGAVEAVTRAVDTMTIVCARAPDNLQYRAELSRAYAALAEAQQVAAEQSGSIDQFQQVLATSIKSLEILETAGRHEEDFWLYALASRHFRVGYAFTELGNRTDDRSYYQRALEIQLKGDAVMRELARMHPEQRRDRELADDLMNIGLSRWKCCDDFDGATRDLRESLDSFRRLADADPHNLEAKRDVGNAWLTLSAVLTEAGRRQEALAISRTALDIFDELDRADPDSRENADFMETARKRIAALEHGR